MLKGKRNKNYHQPFKRMRMHSLSKENCSPDVQRETVPATWIENSFVTKKSPLQQTTNRQAVAHLWHSTSQFEKQENVSYMTSGMKDIFPSSYDSKKSMFSNGANSQNDNGDDSFIQTQHESFNETDPLFADIDMDSLDSTIVSGSPRTLGNQSRRNVDDRKCDDNKSCDTTSPLQNSIKNKYMSALKSNAKLSSPKLSTLENLRKDGVQTALEHSTDIFQHGDQIGIGPFHGLPSKVQDMVTRIKGINDLYDWQKECLSLDAIRLEKNLIYSLPTSGGKTLVAEILIFRELLCKKKDAILILPFVSIVQEKVRGLSAFAVELDFLVEEYAASKGHIPPRKRRNKKSLYVCTIEKANSLINSLIENNRLAEIGLVVVDELHMLGEGGSRGACLEMSLGKVMHLRSNTQIIGMSATLNNIGELQLFLSADVYTNEFRPVQLVENVKLDDTIFQIDQKALCPEDQFQFSRVIAFLCSPEQKKRDPDQVAGLVLEVIPEKSCLVFCPTKKNCENVAELICKSMSRKLLEVKKEERRSLLKALYHDGGGEICPVLKKTLHYGVAYHHSGLTMDERKLIEEAYLEGTLCALCCTSTLAAGVNLPAKRVILRSPFVGQNFITRSQYKQMVGRAGRAGIDTSGESILILQPRDKTRFMDLIGGPFEFCRSSLLYQDGKGLTAHLLASIGLRITTTSESVMQFLKRTLFFVQTQHHGHDITDLAKSGLQKLLDLGMIVQKSSDISSDLPILECTNLGRATFKGSIDISRGSQLYSGLCQATESLVVANYLHLLYLVTPYDMVANVKPRWMGYLNEMAAMNSSELRVANIIGVTESYIAKRAAGQRTRQAVDEFVVARFYVTLVLHNLWTGKSIWDVAAKFSIPRGLVQQLLNGAASFAACVSHFCEELEEFWAYQDLFSNFVKRLAYCVQVELIPLMEIPGVKLGRARQLYSCGYTTLQAVAFATPDALVKEIEHMPHKIARQLVASAMMLLKEKVESLKDEMDDMIAFPEHEHEIQNINDLSSSK